MSSHTKAGLPPQRVWAFLLLLTAVEVLLAFVHLPTLLLLTSLIGLSVVKAALIMAYFMHLRFERLSLFLTLWPVAIVIILALMATLPDAVRSMELR